MLIVYESNSGWGHGSKEHDVYLCMSYAEWYELQQKLPELGRVEEDWPDVPKAMWSAD